MALELTQQINQSIEKSKNALIVLPASPSGDAIGAGWGFYFFLEKRGVSATIAFDDPARNTPKFAFLPHPKKITDSISGAREFVIIFDTSRNKISGIRTKETEKETQIYITPEKGFIDPRDFSFVPAKFKYDLVIVLGSPDKESLGKIYENNPDIFFEAPLINIDNHNNNENFGQINLVDFTASSVSEIIADLLNQLKESLNEKISHCLLTGIISATDSFQSKNTTPKSLQSSARLIKQGANQQEIIRHLYKTQPLNILKLWGRIMARIKWDEKLKLVWSLVTVEDFVQSRSYPSDIPVVLDKIRSNYSTSKIFIVLFGEKQNIIRGIAKFNNEDELNIFANIFPGAKKGDWYEFRLENNDMDKAEKEFLEKLKTRF